jgi:hypothetical protein
MSMTVPTTLWVRSVEARVTPAASFDGMCTMSCRSMREIGTPAIHIMQATARFARSAAV